MQKNVDDPPTAMTRHSPDPLLATVLQRRRRERGVTQEPLAYEAGVTISALSRIERGLSNPTWTTVQRITNTLGITLHQLATNLEEEEERRERPADRLRA